MISINRSCHSEAYLSVIQTTKGRKNLLFVGIGEEILRRFTPLDDRYICRITRLSLPQNCSSLPQTRTEMN
ncbi:MULTISPECIES: hypothetical protein [Bacteroides]|uniref:Uncharacterized protein n=1 Tax=Bacteroides faecis TaxID=674529 RepID=A0ABY5TD32_9BACE|nr:MULTISPECIES: hypothetical protein [Bacteroides]KAA5256038.1 hypothetical protein F2Z43_23470 [Bacteroides faecis]KAA5284652.1 hypothetical protein F2Z11_22560 [Bacteroides faecis]KAA5294021.1 hypothetical protein F2Z35_23110 [Bacteroides faecis]MCC0772984.1 hypothetical protein [Bacteroides faecis]MCC0780825.1 hypothetical protein [Bacteroides faecis]